MRLSKLSKENIFMLSFIMIGFACSMNNVNAASKEDAMLFEAPGLGVLSNNYEEVAKNTVKIDGVKYSAYLKVKNQSGYINAYSNNDVWGLRYGPDGAMYYAPNIGNQNLTLSDINNGVKRMVKGSSYMDNKGDIYWNNSVAYSTASAWGDANKLGSFDKLKNFKPGYQKTNSQVLLPQWPKYPVQEGKGLAGTKEAEGKDYFYGATVGDSSQIHASKIKWRNDAVKTAVGKGIISGEWRILGANAYGKSVSNPNLPKDQGNSSGTVDYKRTWVKTYPTGGYNKSNDPNDILIRETTFDRLNAAINVGTAVKRDGFNDVFHIGAPASEHVTGIVTGYYGNGRQYVSLVVPAEKTLDLALNRMEIKDGDKTVYVMKQETTDMGVKNKTQTDAQYVKLQPGYQYTLEMEIENKSNKTVYNPTFNVLGTVGKKATNTSVTLVDKPAENPGYWTYTNGTMQERKEFGESKKMGAGYFTVSGERLKVNNAGQKVVPALTNGSIAAGEKKVIKINFVIEGADKSTLSKKFEVNNPNNVRIRLAGQVNSKHKIADEVFVWGGIDDSRVKTSTDNMYTVNDVLGMNKAFYTQDMAIGGSSDFVITDEKGNKVTNGEFLKGHKYKFGIKVSNPSGIWGTVNKPKIDYQIKDVGNNKVLVRSSAQGASVLGKEASSYVYFDVVIPMNASNQIQISAELNEIHQKSQEDWYKDNNKFSRTFKVKAPVDLSIKEAMGEKIGDESSPSTVKVFAGETIGLKVYISSQVNYVVNPVEVEFSYKKNGQKVSGVKNIGALDANNPQIVVYPYVAPDKAGTYEVVAHLNPKGKVEEIDTSNNKHTFKVVVEDNVKKYATTTHVEGRKPDGTEKGNSNITVSSIYSSYTPSVTLQRRDPEYVYDEEKDEYVKKWGPWYDYTVEFLDKPLYVTSTESLELTEIKFRSKYTTDRRIEGKDTDLIDAQGFVNLIGGSTSSEKERIQSLGKVKAGYGFELEIKTKYKTDLLDKYKKATSSGVNTKINGVSVSTLATNKINALKKVLPNSEFKVTSKTKFSPSPLERTINAKDQVLSITMPDSKIYNSFDRTLVEKISGGTSSQSKILNEGAIWNYKFTERNDGLNGKSRRYYLNENVPNGEYYIRIGTSKLGIGGLLDIDNAYEGQGKPTRVYAAQDIKIQVYGGRQDDVKDKN